MKLCLHNMKRSETVTLDDISIEETDSRDAGVLKNVGMYQ